MGLPAADGKEDKYIVAQANEELDTDGHFVRNNVSGRFREETSEFAKSKIDLMDVSPKMVFSVATATNTAANRTPFRLFRNFFIHFSLK